MSGPGWMFGYLLPDPEHSLLARSLLAGGYVAAGLVWLRASRRTRHGESGSFAYWWCVGAVLLFLLALSKEFNLRGVFERGIRAIAKAGHWWERRQPMQFVVAVVLPALAAVFVGIVLATRGRAFVRNHRMALLGWVLLLLYLVLRQSQEWKGALPWLEAVHYHDWRLALEAAGIALVMLAGVIERAPPTASTAPDQRKTNRAELD